jgi:hypothetical protein
MSFRPPKTQNIRIYLRATGRPKRRSERGASPAVVYSGSRWVFRPAWDRRQSSRLYPQKSRFKPARFSSSVIDGCFRRRWGCGYLPPHPDVPPPREREV